MASGERMGGPVKGATQREKGWGRGPASCSGGGRLAPAQSRRARDMQAAAWPRHAVGVRQGRENGSPIGGALLQCRTTQSNEV
jgi:hypothetical protein